MDLNDFSLELDDAQDSIEIEPDILENAKAVFDVGSLDFASDDISVELEESLELVADDPSETALSDSIFIRASDSIVETMAPYAKSVAEVMAIYLAKKKRQDALSDFVIPRSDFMFIPDDVFPVFCAQLKDLVQDKSERGKSDEEVAQDSMTMLQQATLWSPQLQTPEYISGFVRHYSRLRKLAEAGLVGKPAQDITALLDYDKLHEALMFYETNTVAFEIINHFFDDAASMAATEAINTEGLGDFVTDYMSRNQLTVLRVKDVYNAVGEYLGSDEVRDMLHLTVDEMLEMKNGELLRRVLLYELDNEVLYPGALRGAVIGSEKGQGALAAFLLDAVRNGSVASSIFITLGNCMYALRAWKDSLLPFLDGLLGFFLAMLKDSALVHPVYYGHITRKDNAFILSYAVGDKTYEVQSDSILCDVLGDKSGARCVPYPLVDGDRGYTVCPPPSLYKPLLNLSRGGRTKVSGAMCYKFTPTISWLSANQILAEDLDTVQDERTTHVNESNSSMLQFLIQYTNTFDDDGTEVLPKCTEHNGTQILSINSGVLGEETRKVCAVIRGENLVAGSGVLLEDANSDSVIVSFTSVNGDVLEESYASTDCTSSSLASEEVDSTADAGFKLQDIVIPAVNASAVGDPLYGEAVRKLCSLCALDYEEELELAKDTVAREFYYVMRVPAIDLLVGSKLLNVYEQFASGQDKMDASNFASLRELFDIIYGVPNSLTSKSVWDAEAEAMLKSAVRVTVDDVCQAIDSVHLDVLALWMVNPSEIRRAPDRRMLDALSYIPEIGSRLRLLENKLIVMKVMTFLGSQVLSIFGKRNYLVAAYNTQLDSDNFNAMNNSVINAAKLKDVKVALPLCKAILERRLNPEAGSFKYYVLERNIYGLFQDMYATAGFTPQLEAYTKFFELSEADLTSITPSEFSVKCGQEKIVNFCNAYRPELLEYLYDGLMDEAMNGDSLQTVVAYDLFNTFYRLIFPTLGKDAEVDSTEAAVIQQAFLDYTGSMFISYVPVVGVSAGELDGGEVDRFMQFVKSPEDFVAACDIPALRTASLEDLRVFKYDASAS